MCFSSTCFPGNQLNRDQQKPELSVPTIARISLLRLIVVVGWGSFITCPHQYSLHRKMGADGGLRQGKNNHGTLEGGRNSPFFSSSSCLVETVWWSHSRSIHETAPIYQPNATIHVARYTSPMDGTRYTVIDFMQRFDCFWCRHVVHKRVHLAWVLGSFCWGVESVRSNTIAVTFVCSMWFLKDFTMVDSSPFFTTIWGAFEWFFQPPYKQIQGEVSCWCGGLMVCNLREALCFKWSDFDECAMAEWPVG